MTTTMIVSLQPFKSWSTMKFFRWNGKSTSKCDPQNGQTYLWNKVSVRLWKWSLWGKMASIASPLTAFNWFCPLYPPPHLLSVLSTPPHPPPCVLDDASGAMPDGWAVSDQLRRGEREGPAVWTVSHSLLCFASLSPPHWFPRWGHSLIAHWWHLFDSGTHQA